MQIVQAPWWISRVSPYTSCNPSRPCISSMVVEVIFWKAVFLTWMECWPCMSDMQMWSRTREVAKGEGEGGSASLAHSSSLSASLCRRGCPLSTAPLSHSFSDPHKQGNMKHQYVSSNRMRLDMKAKKNNYRFKRFFELFKQLGITRDLGEKVETWTYNKHNEADRIANLIRNKIKN